MLDANNTDLFFQYSFNDNDTDYSDIENVTNLYVVTSLSQTDSSENTTTEVSSTTIVKDHDESQDLTEVSESNLITDPSSTTDSNSDSDTTATYLSTEGSSTGTTKPNFSTEGSSTDTSATYSSTEGSGTDTTATYSSTVSSSTDTTAPYISTDGSSTDTRPYISTEGSSTDSTKTYISIEGSSTDPSATYSSTEDSSPDKTESSTILRKLSKRSVINIGQENQRPTEAPEIDWTTIPDEDQTVVPYIKVPIEGDLVNMIDPDDSIGKTVQCKEITCVLDEARTATVCFEIGGEVVDQELYERENPLASKKAVCDIMKINPLNSIDNPFSCNL